MIRPIGSRVLVEVLKTEEKTVSELYMPTNSQELNNKATVVAIGDACDVSVGNVVMLEKYHGTQVEVDGKEMLLVDIKSILAVIE